jgi:O-antigen biosynthesis alpha-1,3-mannosyltransferase
MRIGIDISTVLNHGKDVGAGRYITNLVKSLFELDFEDEFVLTGRYLTNEYLWLAEELKQYYLEVNKDIGENFLKTTIPDAYRVNEIAFKPAFNDCNPLADNMKGGKSLKGTVRESKAGSYSISRPVRYKSGKLAFNLIKTTQKKLDLSNKLGFPPMEFYGFKADIFHCPDFLIAPTLNNRIILTIHDLAFIRFPQFNFEWFVKKYTKEVTKNARVAKRIIAVSYSTKNDIVELLKINPGKVDVVHEAADEVFRKLTESEKNYNLQKKYNISKRFILSVGTIEPRKNYVTLIKAFNRLKRDKPQSYDSDLQLVIVGRTGWMSEAAADEYNQSPFKDDIILAGRLSDAELLQMYNLAQLLVYPSIFEGFGLPVIEAMQCGLPVIASNSSSIPELVNDKKLLFNPADEGDILDKINMVLGNERLKDELSEKVLKNAAKFSWKNTAQKTLEVYRQIL